MLHEIYDTLGYALRATFLFSKHFDVICDRTIVSSRHVCLHVNTSAARSMFALMFWRTYTLAKKSFEYMQYQQRL